MATVTPTKTARGVRKGPAKKGRPKGTKMSTERKEAMAFGRDAARAIDHYLDMLHAPKPRIPSEKKLLRIRAELPTARGSKRVQLIQQRNDAETALLSASGNGSTLAAAEADFVKFAKRWSETREPTIGYETWKEAGVPPRVLKVAGISR